MSNKSCIITLVKNEHLYLKEWIEYHLNLGVEHIFVFEDIDSDSHKDITNLFGDKVTLNNIYSILNEANGRKALDLKKTKKRNVQHTYLKSALNYVKSLNKFEWCFVIDADEFLTLEKENDTLDDIFSLYDKYDAFIMLWQCYGANGFLKKPDYKDKGVVETYTQASTQKIDEPQYRVKTCYRLTKYESDFYYNAHLPSSVCNWCNTNHKKNELTATHSKIYIRHYITKSLEEYVWKRKTRGYLWGKTRLFDTFFVFNPEFLPIKKQLIKNVRKQNFDYPAL